VPNLVEHIGCVVGGAAVYFKANVHAGVVERAKSRDYRVKAHVRAGAVRAAGAACAPAPALVAHVLGHGLGGVLRGATSHPGLVVRTLISVPRLDYLDDLLHPLAFTSLLALPVLLLALPALLINMLSADVRMYSGFYQYSAEVVPFVVASNGAPTATTISSSSNVIPTRAPRFLASRRNQPGRCRAAGF